MTFRSILFEGDADNALAQKPEPPAFFSDLYLDQIVDAITSRKQEYNLKPFFYAPLGDPQTVEYRQQVMRDLEDATLMDHVQAFAGKMLLARRYLKLAEQLEFNYHKKGWFLEAALAYCDALTDLTQGLTEANLRSRGLFAFRDYLTSYVRTPAFQSLADEARRVKRGLADVKYCVNIGVRRFSVRKYEGEADYSAEVEKTFEKFKQGAVKDYRSSVYKTSGMSYVEAKMLDFVARLYPDRFSALDRFCSAHPQFVDQTILVFDREIQFYVAYLELVADLTRKGLAFCYPEVSATSREVFNHDGFDLALALTLLRASKPIVCNDFGLKDPERIIVVSGPNQGGKTTFARTFGQLHYLASLGCPVPGSEARLFLFDHIFTHFEKQEDIANLRGKLQDDLVRIHEILAQATSRSIFIINEMFASTTLQDAVFLSKEIMQQVLDLDALCVWVTFIDELSSLSEKTVSMVSTVVPENPALRTYKIVRKPADGLAYAHSIAEKYRLSAANIEERIPS